MTGDEQVQQKEQLRTCGSAVGRPGRASSRGEADQTARPKAPLYMNSFDRRPLFVKGSS
jgi:hypothetical protein